jgi:hypothetical protein
MNSCYQWQRWNENNTAEATMKALFFSMALAAGLALWGAEPSAGADHLMAAGHVAGEQVYNILH